MLVLRRLEKMGSLPVLFSNMILLILLVMAMRRLFLSSQGLPAMLAIEVKVLLLVPTSSSLGSTAPRGLLKSANVQETSAENNCSQCLKELGGS